MLGGDTNGQQRISNNITAKKTLQDAVFVPFTVSTPLSWCCCSRCCRARRGWRCKYTDHGSLADLVTFWSDVCGAVPPLIAFPRGFFVEASPRLICNGRPRGPNSNNTNVTTTIWFAGGPDHHCLVCGYLPPVAAFPQGFFGEACPRLARNGRLRGSNNNNNNNNNNNTNNIKKSNIVRRQTLLLFGICGSLLPLTAFSRGFFAEACPRLVGNGRLRGNNKQ